MQTFKSGDLLLCVKCPIKSRVGKVFKFIEYGNFGAYCTIKCNGHHLFKEDEVVKLSKTQQYLYAEE